MHTRAVLLLTLFFGLGLLPASGQDTQSEETLTDSQKIEILKKQLDELDQRIRIAERQKEIKEEEAAAKLKAEWQRDGRLDNVTYSLRQDKVLGFLIGKASITAQLTRRSNTGVQELAFFHLHDKDWA